MRRRQLLPTLTILVGVGLLLAGVYREVPAWLGMGGVALLFAGGIWTLLQAGERRRELMQGYASDFGGVPPTLGGFPDGHHGGHHHGGFDGGFFDGGGGGSDGGGGGG